MLDENQVGDGNLVVRIDIASHRAGAPLGMRTAMLGMCSKESGMDNRRIFNSLFLVRIARRCTRPNRTHQLNAPARAARRERALRFHERWSLAFKNPHISVGRLLAEQRRECA